VISLPFRRSIREAGTAECRLDVLSTALTLMLGSILAAWAVTTLILLSAPFFARVLRRRGLKAIERLMGLLLNVVAVQMFLDGLPLPARVP
jgi:small neutral amino acid transporter SnatA (MarC family)